MKGLKDFSYVDALKVGGLIASIGGAVCNAAGNVIQKKQLDLTIDQKVAAAVAKMVGANTNDLLPK